jgi:hypothetical protein
MAHKMNDNSIYYLLKSVTGIVNGIKGEKWFQQVG